MKEVNESMELDPFEDSDLSSDSDFDSPEKSTMVSRFICGHRENEVGTYETLPILHFEKRYLST